ncbi:MAG: hypothetical protein K2X82_12255 [Gemmataceae bacterium]|nr:hypothetical protein [Gemmataceae bacterium]
MLPVVLREQFPDRRWAAADLDAAAEFWLRLYEAAAPKRGFSRSPSHAVEIRLRGFGRKDGDALVKEAAHRVAASDMPEPEVELTDPDTLVIRSGVIGGDESPAAGLGLPLLAGPPFDGLMAEVRVEAVSRDAAIGRDVGNSLVMVGELAGGGLVLKALWRAGASARLDAVHWAGLWPEEEKWLAAFDEFRGTDTVPADLARRIFLTRGTDSQIGLIIRLIHAPLGKPRPAGLVARGLIFVALYAAAVAVTYWTAVTFPLLLITVGVFDFILLWLTWWFLKTEAQLWFVGYAELRGRYARLYDEAVKVVPLTPAEAAPRVDHPAARKYAADLRAAGYAHLGDLRTDPPATGEITIRVFLAPDGVTYLNLVHLTTTTPDPADGVRAWPANTAALAETHYRDGGRFASVGGRDEGYRKKRSGPEYRLRIFPDADEPLAFVDSHTEAAAGWAAETGRTPLAHKRLDEFARRQNELHDDERRLFADDPYTRGDHLRWYLQSPRGEYLG